MNERPCTCHPDDNPPEPCPQKFALSECRKAAAHLAQVEAIVAAFDPKEHADTAWQMGKIQHMSLRIACEIYGEEIVRGVWKLGFGSGVCTGIKVTAAAVKEISK